MATIGFYFPLSSPAANALRARLNQIAGQMGYTAHAGATTGQGNLAALLQAIDVGEVALVLLADEELARAIPALEQLHAADEFHNSWAGSLAHSLRQALERLHQVDVAELAEYRDGD